MGRFGPAFLAFDNFQVLLKWNQSLVYTTTRRLSREPHQRRAAGCARCAPASLRSPRAEVFDLQRLLTARGYNIGNVDGKLGLGTRAAVKQASSCGSGYPPIPILRLS